MKSAYSGRCIGAVLPDGAAASLEGADLPQPALSILDTVCRGRLERSSRFGIR